jgi:NADPH-dependent F420 reductase
MERANVHGRSVSQSPIGIGIVGGTGPEGFGLATRWCLAGESVVIGSRSEERALDAARRIRAGQPGADVDGADNIAVAERANIVVIAVPVQALESTLTPLASALRDKLVVSVVAALEFPGGRPRPVHLPAGSGAQEVQHLLPGARVTSAFHTLSAEKLGDLSVSFDEDTIVCGDDREARQETMNVGRKIAGVRPISGGRLENSYYPELMVGLLATLNRIHKAHSGIRIADIAI